MVKNTTQNPSLPSAENGPSAKCQGPFTLKIVLLGTGIGLVGACLCGLPTGLQAAQSAYPVSVLEGQGMRVHFYLPDATRGYYRGTRFDWSGLVSSVECEGHKYFCEFKQEHDPLNHDDICGTAEEFGISKPAGYEEASTGGLFLKPGVGLLEKPDNKEYSFTRRYKIAAAPEWQLKRSENRVTFRQELAVQDGWGYSFEKVLAIDAVSKTLTIRRTLKNTGRKAIETDHYGHNFLKIDDTPAGPDYALEYPFAVRLAPESRSEGALEAKGNSLAFLKAVPDGKAVWVRLDGFYAGSMNEVVIHNRKTGASLAIATDQPLAKMAFFSKDGVLSPEPFIQVLVAPGASKVWTTVYTFQR